MSQPSKISTTPPTPRRSTRMPNNLKSLTIQKSDDESSDEMEARRTDDHKKVSQEFREPDIYPQFISYRPARRPFSPSYQKRTLEHNDLKPSSPTEKSGFVCSSNKRKTINTKTISTKQRTSKNDVSSESTSQMLSAILCMIVVISVVVSILIFGNYNFGFMNHKYRNITMEAIIEKFPKQDSQFWKAIITGIEDTISFQRPTSYIFLFKNEGEETAKKLLGEVSKYAVFKLTNSNNSAINFTEEILKSPKFSNVHDYGSVISHLKDKLENNGLMIIENLDKIPEKYALAFHNFCDDVSPLVKKSAFFFTLKVHDFESDIVYDLRNAEKALRKSCPNMEEDIFDPLFARISSMILRVYP